jgi:hypothetical protein
MSGPDGNWHSARRRHLRVCREAAWGQLPEDPGWVSLPVFGDGFTLKAASPHFAPATEFGGWRRTARLGYVRRVTGAFVTLPWPEVTALLLQMALERDAAELHSYCLDFFTPADPRRYSGVMADRLEVTARTQEDVIFRFQLVGKDEEANPALSQGDFDYSGQCPVPFRLERAALNLDGAPVTGVESFALRVENDLAEGPIRFGTVSYLLAGPRTVGLSLRSLDNSGAFNEAIREDPAVSFDARFVHPDGHELTLSLPALHVESNEPTALPGALARTVAGMTAGTDEHGDDITYALVLNA